MKKHLKLPTLDWLRTASYLGRKVKENSYCIDIISGMGVEEKRGHYMEGETGTCVCGRICPKNTELPKYTTTLTGNDFRYPAFHCNHNTAAIQNPFIDSEPSVIRKRYAIKDLQNIN